MQSNGSVSVVSSRSNAIATHYKAVERVILAMRERLGDPLTLEELAEIAIISPYHFDRVFRHLVGIPPFQFLGTLRMEAAKRLLLTTRLSVTDVSLEVGYNSLGTFITRFTQLVGVAPRRLRRLATDADSLRLRSLRHRFGDFVDNRMGSPAVAGKVSSDEVFDGLIFVGLFPTPIPQSKPIGCALMTAPGPFRIPVVSDGYYYTLAAAIPWSEDPLAYLLADRASLRLAVGKGPVLVQKGQVSGKVELVLRPPELTDPPLLIVLPLLFTDFLAKPCPVGLAKDLCG